MRNYKFLSSAILFLLLGMTVFFASRIPKLSFDYDFEKFFPEGDEDSKTFEDFRTNFENDYDFLLIGIKNEGSLFNPDFLQKVQNLTDSLETIPRVTEVISPTNFSLTVKAGLFPSKKRLLHPESREKLITDSTNIYKYGFLSGVFFSEDAQSVCILLKTEEKISKKKSDIVLAQIEKCIAQSSLKDVYIAGKLKAQKVYSDAIQVEFIKFFVIALIFVILVLIFTYRSIQGLIVPLTVVLVSVIWTLGFMEITGKKIDILSALLPTILFVVGMSDAIHIYSKYLEELSSGKLKIEAIQFTLKEVGLATFLTSFTTAIGFLTLITAGIQPVTDLGLYTAAGVMFAYVITILMMPAVFALLPAPILRKKDVGESKILTRLLHFIFGNYRKIIVVSVILMVVSLIGSYFITVNNFLIEDLRESSELKRSINRFETDFSGIRPFEMLVESAPGHTVIDYESVKTIQIVESFVKDKFKTGFIASPVSMIKIGNFSMNSGLFEYFKIPESKQKYDELIQELKNNGAFENEEFKKYITSDFKKARLSAKMHDIGSKKVNQAEKEFNEFTAREISNSGLRFKLTGSARLVDKNIQNLTINLMQGLAFAILIISLIVGLMYRSFKMVFIALIPNILPLAMVAGIMVLADIHLKTSTAIIFTIGFGIAVDDTIHFLSRLRIELAEGKHLFFAVKRTFLSTGKAIVLTTVVLVSGFLPMVASDFLTTFFLGVLLSLILIIAVLADLFLLPSLIIFTYRKDRKLIPFGIKKRNNTSE